MIDHVSLGTIRYADAVGFYSRVLAPLGLSLQRDTGAEAAFGSAQNWSFFLYPVDDAGRITAPGDAPCVRRSIARAGGGGA